MLFPDSFCARGRAEICTIENRLWTITQVNRRLDVPNGVHPGQGVTVAPNPDARADAYLRLKAYLRTELAERFDDGSRHCSRRIALIARDQLQYCKTAQQSPERAADAEQGHP